MLIVNNYCADTWEGPEGVRLDRGFTVLCKKLVKRIRSSLQLLRITNLYTNESLYLRDEMI